MDEADVEATIRVVVADDHRILREGVRRCLEDAGLTVVEGVGDGLAAVRAVDEHVPDVVIMDVSLPGLGGIEATRRIRERHPGIGVVMLTMFADPTTLQEAIRAGAAGYLVKDCTTEDMLAVVRTVATGGIALSAGAAGSLMELAHEDHDTVLSRREVEVLQLLAEGASTADVARKLYISIKTVKNHLSSIYEKLDARDRTQAVLAAQRLGIVRPPGPKVLHSA